MQTHGEATWKSVQTNIKYVLTHPNGWGGSQQAEMRRAAVLASLVSENEKDQLRIAFVTEGEASLHYCLLSGMTAEGIEVSHRSFWITAAHLMSDNCQGTAGVIIVDAGGGTIDVTSYRRVSSKSFEEIANPKCTLTFTCLERSHLNPSRFLSRSCIRDNAGAAAS